MAHADPNFSSRSPFSGQKQQRCQAVPSVFNEPECTKTFPTSYSAFPKCGPIVLQKAIGCTQTLLNLTSRHATNHPHSSSGYWVGVTLAHLSTLKYIIYFVYPHRDHFFASGQRQQVIYQHSICSVLEVGSQHTPPYTVQRMLRDHLKEITPRRPRRTNRPRLQISLSLRSMDRLPPSGYVPILSR